jgi:hypothetical protein
MSSPDRSRWPGVDVKINATGSFGRGAAKWTWLCAQRLGEQQIRRVAITAKRNVLQKAQRRYSRFPNGRREEYAAAKLTAKLFEGRSRALQPQRPSGAGRPFKQFGLGAIPRKEPLRPLMRAARRTTNSDWTGSGQRQRSPRFVGKACG